MENKKQSAKKITKKTSDSKLGKAVVDQNLIARYELEIKKFENQNNKELDQLNVTILQHDGIVKNLEILISEEESVEEPNDALLEDWKKDLEINTIEGREATIQFNRAVIRHNAFIKHMKEKVEKLKKDVKPN